MIGFERPKSVLLGTECLDLAGRRACYWEQNPWIWAAEERATEKRILGFGRPKSVLLGTDFLALGGRKACYWEQDPWLWAADERATVHKNPWKLRCACEALDNAAFGRVPSEESCCCILGMLRCICETALRL